MQENVSDALAKSDAVARRELFRDLRVAVALVVVVAVVWVVTVQVSRRTFSPPRDAKTLDELSRTGEPISHLSQVTVGTEKFYVWLGRTVWLAAPSGPACYVFDHRGKLVAYTPTTGDRELSQYCDKAWKEPALTLSKVLADSRQVPR